MQIPCHFIDAGFASKRAAEMRITANGRTHSVRPHHGGSIPAAAVAIATQLGASSAPGRCRADSRYPPRPRVHRDAGSRSTRRSGHPGAAIARGPVAARDRRLASLAGTRMANPPMADGARITRWQTSSAGATPRVRPCRPRCSGRPVRRKPRSASAG